MAFDYTFCAIPVQDAQRLTRDAIAARAVNHGLASVYTVASVEIVPRRWRRTLVDVVVHMEHGEDILGTQFPDEAREAVTLAVDELLRDPRADAGAPDSVSSALVTPRPSQRQHDRR